MTRSEFEHIAAQLRQRVLKVGLDFFGNKEDAEDAAQETMVQLWRYLEHIDAGRNVEVLAVRVAKNCCVSMYRKSSHRDSNFVRPLDNVTKEPNKRTVPLLQLARGTAGGTRYPATIIRSDGLAETARTRAFRDATDRRALNG